MGRRLLTGRSRSPRGASAGFTLIETLTAMAITIVVMLANLFLFSTASKNLAAARVLTEATNLATGSLSNFRAMTIAQIEAAAPSVDPTPNPLDVRRGTDTVTAGGVPFTRTWVVSRVDLEGDGIADMVGDLLSIKVDVAWTRAGRDHRVSMTTFTTGESP